MHTIGSQWSSSATVIAWLLLVALGAVMVNSATVAMTGAYTEKHLVFLALGTIGLIFGLLSSP